MAQGIGNMASTSLTPLQNELIKQMLGEGRQAKATAVITLFTNELGSDEWTRFDIHGVTVCCFVKDNLKKAYYICVFNLAVKLMILEQKVHEILDYESACSYFHTFSGNNVTYFSNQGVTIGLSFAVDKEAYTFCGAVFKEKERLKKLREKNMQRRGQSPLLPPPLPITIDAATNDIQAVPSASPPVVSTLLGSLSLSRSEITAEKKQQKKFKKSDVLAPTDFKHVGHVNFNPTTGELESHNIAPEWEKLLDTISVNREQRHSFSRDHGENKLHYDNLPSPPVIHRKRGSGLLYVDPELPKSILSEPPKAVVITPQGNQINLQEEMGVSISVPTGATSMEKQIRLAASFSGAYQVQGDVESVSPAYIIDTKEKIQFSEDVAIKMQHTANVTTAEERDDLMVIRASTFPSPSQSNSNTSPSTSTHEFEEVQGVKVEMSGAHHVVMKVRSLVSSIFKIGRKKRKTREKFYSARLYKAVVGIKVKAVFCVCPEHPIYTKHCDQVIEQKYPDVSDKATGIFINAIIINSEEVSLVNSVTAYWVVEMDRSMISALEVDAPERINVSLAELDDYPPKIHIDLRPIDGTSASVKLRVTGLKKECCFSIINECHMPDVNTSELSAATKEVETELKRVDEYDSPLVSCAMEMVGIMNEVEILLHNHSSVSTLVTRAIQIEDLMRKVLDLTGGAKTVKASIAKVVAISHQFKTVAPAMRESLEASGCPERWKGAVDVLMANSISLMNSIKELLKTTEIAATTTKGVTMRSMKLIRWKDEKFRLIDHVSSKWESFGLCLNIPLDKLQAWREECLGDASKCWQKVMGLWLAGGGTHEYPVTWEGLCLLLEDVEYSEVAKKLRTLIAAMEHKPNADTAN